MSTRIGIILVVAAAFLASPVCELTSLGCAPCPPSGKPVVNADQTVVILWDAATRTEHFIRRAAFKSDAEDFGFLVPTPSQPELEEAGDEAFPYLQALTEPEKRKLSRGIPGCSCGGSSPSMKGAATGKASVSVLQAKLVAGFHAVVLETESADALVNWLKDNGYAFSPAIKAWAEPYVQAGWKITALKVAKVKGQDDRSVAATALRMSFKTDRPLFPYREPDARSAAETLGATRRLLRIYCIAEARYRGELTRDVAWTGQAVWANELTAENRKKTLELLKLPQTTGPADWWLTEFEDDWPYQVAPADVYFSRAPKQDELKRPPIIEYASTGWPTDAMSYAIAAAVTLPLLRRAGRLVRARKNTAE